MNSAYVDSSVMVAMAFEEAGVHVAARRLRQFAHVYAAPLLEAELSSALCREGRNLYPDLLSAVEWVHPDRTLGIEIERVLAAGYLRGADCWHLATALFVSPDPRSLVFLTLDARQRAVAKTLGFTV